MPEEFEQETSQGFDAGRLLDIVRRRHLQFLLPLLVGWLLVWGSSWFLQARYKSATSILVGAHDPVHAEPTGGGPRQPGPSGSQDPGFPGGAHRRTAYPADDQSADSRRTASAISE